MSEKIHVFLNDRRTCWFMCLCYDRSMYHHPNIVIYIYIYVNDSKQFQAFQGPGLHLDLHTELSRLCVCVSECEHTLKSVWHQQLSLTPLERLTCTLLEGCARGTCTLLRGFKVCGGVVTFKGHTCSSCCERQITDQFVSASAHFLQSAHCKKMTTSSKRGGMQGQTTGPLTHNATRHRHGGAANGWLFLICCSVLQHPDLWWSGIRSADCPQWPNLTWRGSVQFLWSTYLKTLLFLVLHSRALHRPETPDRVRPQLQSEPNRLSGACRPLLYSISILERYGNTLLLKTVL